MSGGVQGNNIIIYLADNCVCLEAYLLSKRRNWENTHSGPMPKEEETFQKLQFKLLDVDGSGNIDYWEFVKNDGCKKLARRSKVWLDTKRLNPIIDAPQRSKELFVVLLLCRLCSCDMFCVWSHQ